MHKPEIIPIAHDFKHTALDKINESQRQREFRKLAPIPFGSVLIARDEMDEATIRWHLKTMRELGFNAIKQFMPSPKWSNAKLEALALEEGLVPWWYGEGGWEPITDALCQRLGIDPEASLESIRSDPRMLEHQREVLRKRIGRGKLSLNPEVQAGMFVEKKSIAKAYGTNAELPEWAVEEFVVWLKEHYDNDLAKLNEAWNMDVFALGGPDGPIGPFTSWEQVADHKLISNKRDYSRIRDILRFKADLKNRNVEDICKVARERDPYEPHRSGGEMGLFLPFASRGTDMEGIARAMKDTGSFYPSIHLCWHFEETYFEVARPVFMQATFVCDLNKGGWTAPWESTGGPQQTSGSNAPLFQWARDIQAGYTVDAGVMTQLLFSYFAAGCKGVGLWAWNQRQAGVEAGEYGLLDRNEQVCPRTRRVGQIAKAANRLRDELWSAHKEPQVGILMDWDNEACWAAMSEFNRMVYKHYPIEARIGACRICIDNSIPFEYVTAQNLREGLAQRYPIIYLPGFLGLNKTLLPILTEYVKNGGRVVLDMPGGGYDHTGRMLRTKRGTAFETLFGVELSDLQFSGSNVDWYLEGDLIQGYVADLLPTTAKTLTSYSNGRPAVTVNTLGKGTAVILGWESGRTCYRPGKSAWQQRAAKFILGHQKTYYWCDGQPWAYRLVAPKADHYFVLNEGEPAAAVFKRLPFEYKNCVDVLSGEAIKLNEPIAIDGNDGRWLRCEK